MAQTVNGSGSQTEAIMTLAKRVHNVKSTSEDAVTLTVAEFINGLYIQGGTPGTSTKTTPTAALIVAAIPEAAVGTMFEFTIDNGGDGTLTLEGGDGVTLSGTATVATTKNRTFRAYITAVDTPAVRVVCGAALA
jgi:hypothetical protein